MQEKRWGFKRWRKKHEEVGKEHEKVGKKHEKVGEKHEKVGKKHVQDGDVEVIELIIILFKDI